MEAYLSLYPNPIFRVEESPFTDADDPVITKAYYLGLISGFPDGTFRPDIPITGSNFSKSPLTSCPSVAILMKTAPAPASTTSPTPES